MNDRPLPPPPRQVRLPRIWRDYHTLGWFLAGFAFILVSLIQGIVFTWLAMPWIDHSLDRGGQTTTGRLISSEIVHSEHYGSRHPTRFTYDFEVFAGVENQTFRGRSKTLEPDRIQIGDNGEVSVVFAEGRPQWNRIKGTRFSIFPRWALAFPYLMFPIGVLMVGAGVRQRRRLLHILTHGDEVTGTVTGVRLLWYKHSKITKTQARRVSFHFTHPFGGDRSATIDTFNEEVDALMEGSPIRLLVMRERPAEVAAVDLEDGVEFDC